jgi:cation transport ATPase
MNDKKSKRLFFRTSILILLLLLVGYTLYQNLTKNSSKSLQLGEKAPNFKLEN